MVSQNQTMARDEEEPLILDEGQDANEVGFGDIAREFSIMGWIGFGGV